MKIIFLNFAIFCLALNVVTSKNLQNRYDGFKVFRVNIPNVAAVNVINNDLKDYVDIWAEPRIGHHSDIMVSPSDLAVVESKLKQAIMEYSIMVENVQELINAEKVPANKKTMVSESADHPMTWTEYHSQDDMEAYMDYLVEKFPELVSIEEIGASYEGRTMRVLRICKGGTCGNKPGMWIDGGIHSREWVSPSTVTYIMKELVEKGNEYPSQIVDQIDWYILPVLNPDGYEYSRTSDRMWRKSRYIIH